MEVLPLATQTWRSGSRPRRSPQRELPPPTTQRTSDRPGGPGRSCRSVRAKITRQATKRSRSTMTGTPKIRRYRRDRLSGRPVRRSNRTSGAVLIATAVIMPEREGDIKDVAAEGHAFVEPRRSGSRSWPARRRARSRRGRRVLTLGSAGRCSQTPGFRPHRCSRAAPGLGRARSHVACPAASSLCPGALRPHQGQRGACLPGSDAYSRTDCGSADRRSIRRASGRLRLRGR